MVFAGNYLRRINAPSTFAFTSVLGGQLDLNATGGNAIPNHLTLNVSNTATTSVINNVNFLQSNQIADTAAVTLSATGVGVLNLGSFNDTIATLSMGGGRIAGSGTLTLSNLTGSTFTGGTFGPGVIEAALAGNGTLAKTGTGQLVLSGANSYTGATDLQAGSIVARSGTALGASGLGNGTTVGAAGQLQLLGTYTTAEDLTSNFGTGVRVLSGNITSTGSITYGATVPSATLSIDSGSLSLTGATSVNGAAGNTNLSVTGNGELIVSTPISLGTGVVSRNGNGTLTFAYDTLGTIPATLISGAIGFSGVQTGTYTAPVAANQALKFNTDPTATIDAPAGSTVLAGFAPDQNFVSRFTPASAGNLVLTTDTASNLDFSAGPNLSLGARGLVTYSGTLTPNAATYQLGGSFPGDDALQSILAITQPLTGGNGLNIRAGGAVDLTRIANTFSVPVTNNGGTAIFTNASSFGNGAATNTITLTNGGILRLAQTSGNAGQIFIDYGPNFATGVTRTITIGAGGGTIDVPAFIGGNNGFAISGPNGLQGAAGTTLAKSGLGFLFLTNTSNFAGDLVIAAQGNQVDLRALGALPNVASITINQSGALNLNNVFNLGQGRAPIFANTYIANRINDAAPITLNGGAILFTPRGAAGQTAETFGAVTLNTGYNNLNANSDPGSSQGSDITLTTLRHNTGGTLRLGGTAGAFGGVGANNTRVVIGNLQLNAGAAAPPVDDQILSFATAFGVDLMQYEVATAPASLRVATYVPQTANTTTTAFAPTTPNIYRIDSGTTTAGASNSTTITGNASMGGLKFNSQDTNQTLAFAAATDTLFIGTANSFGGAITAQNSSTTAGRTIAIGSAVNNGKLTAGPSAGGSGTQELYFHWRGGAGSGITFNVNSNIVDNGALPVAVVKDDDGTIQFQAANTYTGGTFLNRGRINVSLAGGLGTGVVTVKNSALQVSAPGAVTAGASTPAAGDPVYNIIDQSELFLSSTGAYTTATDRFDLAAGSMVSSPGGTANGGLNSLTYLALGVPFSAGGQIRLAPGAIVRNTSPAQNGDLGTGVNVIKGLPNDASFFLNFGSTSGDGTTLSIGSGTPWRGLASGRTGGAFSAGTIFANSDFELQGTNFDNTAGTFSLGGTNTGTYNIVNASGKPISALVTGLVAMNEGSPVSMPSDLTFVVSDGALLAPSLPNQFGSGANVAKVLVQAGGTLDPGPYAAVGALANQPQGFVYPVPGPINASQTIIESGGRLLNNDASGLGTSPVGSTQFKTSSVFDLGNSQAFLGANNGLIQSDHIREALPIICANFANPKKFSGRAPDSERVTKPNR